VKTGIRKIIIFEILCPYCLNEKAVLNFKSNVSEDLFNAIKEKRGEYPVYECEHCGREFWIDNITLMNLMAKMNSREKVKKYDIIKGEMNIPEKVPEPYEKYLKENEE